MATKTCDLRGKAVEGEPASGDCLSLNAECWYASFMPTPLPEHDVRNELLKLPGWHLKGTAIERQFRFADFKQAMVFVNRVAEAAEEAGHHPDITISYNIVTMSLVSHDSGGVTQRDIQMASRINEIAG